MFTDFVMNGQASGEFGETLASIGYDYGLMRPYLDRDKQGRTRRFVDVDTGQRVLNKETGKQMRVTRKELAEHTACPILATNATTLRKDDWLLFDKKLVPPYRQRLRAYSDIRSANTFGGFDGMGVMEIQHETLSDVGQAIVDMDGLSDSRADSPLFQLQATPLPIIHDGFHYSERQLAVSRKMGVPLSTRRGEMAARRVGEMIEQLTIGTVTGPSWYGETLASYGNTPQVYGLTTFPDRITSVSLTTPTSSNSATTIGSILDMRQAAYDAKVYGPFVLYHSDGWDAFLDNDHYVLATSGMAAPSQTLRQRITQIEGITAVRRLDFLTSDYQFLLVDMTSSMVEAVNGMEMRTIQWDTRGGMQKNFRVMAIQVPRFFADAAGNCGIVHATN